MRVMNSTLGKAAHELSHSSADNGHSTVTTDLSSASNCGGPAAAILSIDVEAVTRTPDALNAFPGTRSCRLELVSQPVNGGLEHLAPA